jgi:hypothetical protein
MTVIELTEKLGETISVIHEAEPGSAELATALRKASGEAALAKQYIKAADIILRADRNSGRNDRIDEIVG